MHNVQPDEPASLYNILSITVHGHALAARDIVCGHNSFDGGSRPHQAIKGRPNQRLERSRMCVGVKSKELHSNVKLRMHTLEDLVMTEGDNTRRRIRSVSWARRREVSLWHTPYAGGTLSSANFFSPPLLHETEDCEKVSRIEYMANPTRTALCSIESCYATKM